MLKPKALEESPSTNFSCCDNNLVVVSNVPAANVVIPGSIIVLDFSSPAVGTLIPNADPFSLQSSHDYKGYVPISGIEVLNRDLALLFRKQCQLPQEEALENLS